MHNYLMLVIVLLALTGCQAYTSPPSHQPSLSVSESQTITEETSIEATSIKEQPAFPYNPKEIGSDVLLAFTKDDKMGLVDKTTWNIVVEPIYLSIAQFSDGLVLAELEDQFHYLNEQGNVSVTVERNYQHMFAGPFIDGIAEIGILYVYDNNDLSNWDINLDKFGPYLHKISGLINKAGKYILPIRYSLDNTWNDRGTQIVAEVTGDALWGVINKQGEYIIDPIFESIDFSSIDIGIMSAEVNGKWGYINQYGDIVIEPQYAYVETFSNYKAEHTGHAFVNNIYIVASHIDETDIYFSNTDMASMRVYSRKTIDTNGNIIMDDGFLYVEHFKMGIGTKTEKYKLPKDGESSENLVAISFKDMAIVNDGHWINVFKNAVKDDSDKWYLTYEYPPIMAIKVEE